MKRAINNLLAQFNLYTFLVFLAAFLFLLLLIYPKGREIYRNKLALEQKKIRLNNAEIAVSELPAISRDYLKVKELLERETALLVKPEQVGDILLLIDSAVKQSKASLISVSTRNDKISDRFSFGAFYQFQLLPVELQIKGSFEQIGSFMDSLLCSKKWVLLDQAVIEGKGQPSMLSASLKFDFFMQALPTKANPEKKGDENV